MYNKLSENAIKILNARYLAKDNEGNVIETPKMRFWNVAREVAEAELKFDCINKLTTEKKNKFVETITEKFFNIMWQLDFLPNSPTLMNAGKNIPDKYKQYSACTVVDIQDNMESIGDAIKHVMLLHKTGAGTGMSFNNLRPKGAIVNTTKGEASGPVSFMKIFNSATEEVKQGGTRRGANMGILEITHPDIEEFIDIKSQKGVMENFNLSVGIYDDFMESVKNNDRFWNLSFGTFKNLSKVVNPVKLFDQIALRAWENGEPGVIFLDRINEFNTVPGLGMINSTNPCGEQPLLPFEACNLGSINLLNFVDENGNWDLNRLHEVIKIAIRFLDNIVQINNFPVEKFYELVRGNRKIGLGVMGWADVLLVKKIPYNSEKACKEAEYIMSKIQQFADDASEELAEERGNFPNHHLSIYKNKRKMRNATRTTIAPTGTLSRIAGVNFGIEPLFDIITISKILDDQELVSFHPIVQKELDKRGINVKCYNDLPDDMKEYIVLAHQIEPEWHVKMQAAFQKYCDNAVSKTVNLPNDATVDDIKKIYYLAWKLGCKGITVYRDGSREEQPITTIKKKEDVTHNTFKQTATVQDSHECHAGSIKLLPKEVSKNAPSRTMRIPTGCGTLIVTLIFNEEETELTELFITTGKNGGCKCNTEALAMTVSALLRLDADPNYIVKILRQGDICNSFREAKRNNPDMEGKSCADAIGIQIQKILKLLEEKGSKFIVQNNTTTLSKDISTKTNNEREIEKCPVCGRKLKRVEGCVSCVCGEYDKCGGI